MPENTNASATPNDKPKLRWSLPDSARPTPDLLRRVPELEGIENNPWFVLLMADRGTESRRFTYRQIIVSTMLLSIGACFLTVVLILAGPSAKHYLLVDDTSLFLGVASYLLFFMVLLHLGGHLLGGIFHPLRQALRFAADPMYDLFAVRGSPREIARAWFAYYCIPDQRRSFGFLLLLLTPISILFAVLLTWEYRTSAAQIFVIPPMLAAAYGWGILPRYERVMLNFAARLPARSLRVWNDPLKDTLSWYFQIGRMIAAILWQVSVLLASGFALLWTINKLELVSLGAEMFPGVTVWPFYCFWAILAAFIFGLAQSIWASKLYKDNLNLLAEKSQAVLRLLFANRIEFDPPAKLPRRNFREFLHWLFRTPITSLTIGRCARVAQTFGSLGFLILAFRHSPPGIKLWDQYADTYYKLVVERGYSIRDAINVTKWSNSGVIIKLGGRAGGLQKIEVILLSIRFDWLADFQHRFTSQSKLALRLRSRSPNPKDYAPIGTDPAIRQSLSSLEIQSPPLHWDSGLSLEDHLQLNEVIFDGVQLSEPLELPSGLRHLELAQCSGFHRLKTSLDATFDVVRISRPFNDELSAFFSANAIKGRELNVFLMESPTDLTFLGTNSAFDSVSIIGESVPYSVISLNGIEQIEGLKSFYLNCQRTVGHSLDVTALSICKDLAFITIYGVDSILDESLRSLAKLENLAGAFVLDDTIIRFNALFKEYHSLETRILNEAAFIETKVRWPEAIEKVIANHKARKEAERKAAETPMTESTAEATLWPNASPQTSP